MQFHVVVAKSAPGVVSFGAGTQAFYQVAATLLPALLGLAFFSLKQAEGLQGFLDFVHDWTLRTYRDRPGFSRRNARRRWAQLGLFVLSLGLAVATTVGTPLLAVVGEVVALDALYRGHASLTAGRVVVIALIAAIATVVLTLVFWLLGNLYKSKSEQSWEAEWKPFDREGDKETSWDDGQ